MRVLLLAFGWVAVVVVILCLIVACVVASVFYPFSSSRSGRACAAIIESSMAFSRSRASCRFLHSLASLASRAECQFTAALLSSACVLPPSCSTAGESTPTSQSGITTFHFPFLSSHANTSTSAGAARINVANANILTFASPAIRRGSFPHHEVARILSRPRPLHWRRLARVVRCDVRGCHLECISALLQARIRGHSLSPARV